MITCMLSTRFVQTPCHFASSPAQNSPSLTIQSNKKCPARFRCIWHMTYPLVLHSLNFYPSTPFANIFTLDYLCLQNKVFNDNIYSFNANIYSTSNHHKYSFGTSNHHICASKTLHNIILVQRKRCTRQAAVGCSQVYMMKSDCECAIKGSCECASTLTVSVH